MWLDTGMLETFESSSRRVLSPMKQPKNPRVQVFVIVALLILTLPLFYLLVSRVLLPLEWNEPQFSSPVDEGDAG